MTNTECKSSLGVAVRDLCSTERILINSRISQITIRYVVEERKDKF